MTRRQEVGAVIFIALIAFVVARMLPFDSSDVTLTWKIIWAFALGISAALMLTGGKK